MRKLRLSLFVVIIAISFCYSQRKPEVNLLFQIDNPSQDPLRVFTFVGCSGNKLILHSKANNFMVYDFQSKKASEFLKPNILKRVNPSTFFCQRDSVFLGLTKNILFSGVDQINSLKAIPNRGEIIGMRKFNDRLVLLFFDRIRIVDLKGARVDSLMLPQRLRFTGISGISSPFINCSLATQSNLLVPYNRKHENVAREFINVNNAKLQRFGIRFFPADYFEGYIPKAASATRIYWHSIKEPHKILVAEIDNYENQSTIEMDKNVFNYYKARPEIVQIVEGSLGTPDKESSIKMLYSSNRMFIMFRNPNLSTSVYFFEID